MQKIPESIAELREICQAPRLAGSMPWIVRNVHRKVSIYLTKMFLKLNISANRVTMLSALAGVLAGIFFLFDSPLYWIIGALLINLFVALDCCDGEIARYSGGSSMGAYIDVFNGFFIYNFVMVCITLGIYRMFNDYFIIIFGFIILVSTALTMQSELWMEKYRAIHSLNIKVNKQRSLEIYGRFIFGFNSMFSFILLLAALLDMVTTPFKLWFLTLNVRYSFFVIYTLAILIGTVQRNYFTMKSLKAHP